MALPAGYVIATMRYGVPQRDLQLNVLWYDITGDPGGADEQEDALMIATALVTTFDTELAAVMTTETALHGIQVAYHISGNVFVAGQVFTSTTGDEAGDTLPEYCAAVIQKRTAQPGKSGRGRWYIGSVPESLTDQSFINLTGATKYKALADALKGPVEIGGATLLPQLYSKKDDSLYPVTSTSLNSNLGTERRRLVRPLI